MKRTIITISREFASGGRLIGKKLSNELGIPFYDKELITLAAEKSGLSPEYIENSESQTTSSFLFGLTSGPHSGSYFAQYDMPISDRAFLAQSSAIRELSQKGSCVIVGRCASYVLRDDPDCVRVFIHASLSDRLTRAQNVYNMPEKGLADKLIKTDKSRANYYKFYTGEVWNDMRSYDLSINTASFGIDGATAAISNLVKNR